MSPVEADVGIDTMEIRARDDDAASFEPIVLDRTDAIDFELSPSDDEVISDTTREVGLNPLKPSFEGGYKWWVSDGTSRFWVTMHDLDFMQLVESSAESFSSGDILRCQLRDRQIRTASGELSMEHIVMKVLEHLRRPPPDELPIPD